MAKKRVNELAREHDMPAKEVLAKLKAAGIEVNAAASAVDEDAARAAIAGKPLPQKASDNGQ
jgi:DNA polymerase I-like protein with 3'-5' exonuclease and polymerase domains